MSLYRDVVEQMVTGVEAVGASIMVLGGAVVLARHARGVLGGVRGTTAYERLRSDLGRVLLVGLEVLIVADIVNTIVVEATLRSVGVLGAIVAIRTVLSLSLDVEIDGALPWRRRSDPLPAPAPEARP